MKSLPADRWHRLESCGSTNDEAQRLARAGAAAGTVVIAAEQTRGRGRLGRSWHSPRGESLYLSVVLRPKLPPAQAPLLGLCAGLALHRAARASVASEPVELRLKWPNDLLARQLSRSISDGPFLKLGGILTELVCAGMDIDFVIIGVGCNVHGRAFPAAVPATSLRLLGRDDDRDDWRAIDRLGTQFLVALEEEYDRYLSRGPQPIRAAFVEAAGLGPGHPPVIVKTAYGDPLTGIPLDLGAGGELILRLESGAITTILAGDVALANPIASWPVEP
jgi:BirA family biotin operon repressor/biotin-[acetyl-CoA-carboxylase] ligase